MKLLILLPLSTSLSPARKFSQHNTAATRAARWAGWAQFAQKNPGDPAPVKIEKWQSIKKKTAKTIGAEIEKNIGQQTLQFPAEMDQNTPPKMAGASAKNGGQFTKFGGQSRQKWRAAPPKMAGDLQNLAGSLQNLAEVPQLTQQDSISCKPLKGLKGGERKHKGGEGGKTSPPPPLFNSEVENFYAYATRAHQNFFGIGFVISDRAGIADTILYPAGGVAPGGFFLRVDFPPGVDGVGNFQSRFHEGGFRHAEPPTLLLRAVGHDILDHVADGQHPGSFKKWV